MPSIVASTLSSTGRSARSDMHFASRFLRGIAHLVQLVRFVQSAAVTLKGLCRGLGFALVFALAGASAHAQSAQSYAYEGFPNPGPNEGRYWVDIDNDGRDDLCFLVGNTRLDCYLSNGTALETSPVSFGEIGWTDPESIRWVDQNGDGKVDKTEYQQQRDAAFARTDLDNNGELSSDEYLNEFVDRLDRQIAKTRTAQLKQAAVRFKALDKDNNQQVSVAEFNASGGRMFKRWDTDLNQQVTMAEALPVIETEATKGTAE